MKSIHPGIYFAAAAALVLSGLGYCAFQDDASHSKLDAVFSRAGEGKVFSLSSAHSVTAAYGGVAYTYNFDNETVYASNSKHVGFGGSGGGGLDTFQRLKDQGKVTAVRDMGCKIAHDAATATNPGWSAGREFKQKQDDAAYFATHYCP